MAISYQDAPSLDKTSSLEVLKDFSLRPKNYYYYDSILNKKKKKFFFF